MAPTAWDHFIARARRLHEQARVEAQVPSRVGAYVKRWLPWMRGGLGLLGPGCAFFRHRRAATTCANLGNALPSLGISEPKRRSRWRIFRPGKQLRRSRSENCMPWIFGLSFTFLHDCD